jgi:Holliday junction resolvase
MKAQTSLDKRAESVTMNGDLVLPDFWVEHKRTDTATMSIKREWWEKLVEGARTSGREPALLVTFEKKASPSSKPLDLVLLPLECFERLRGKKP